MNGMFYGCSALTSLDLTKFNTSKVQAMSNMFKNCSSLTSLDLTTFNTSKVTYMIDMFDGCSALTSLDLTKFNTSEVTKMNGMFKNCSKLTTINFGTTNRTLSSLTTMAKMFYGCNALTEIRMGQWTTNSLTDCSNMFRDCSSLKTLLPTDMRPGAKSVNYSTMLSTGLPRFTTTAVTNVSYMFNGCSALEDLYGVSLQSSKITSMEYLLNNCKNLTEIPRHFFYDAFATTNVTNFSYMFNGCSKLTELDLSKLVINNGATTSYMLNKCTSLGDIKAPKTGSSISLPSGKDARSLTVGDRYWFEKGALKAYNSSYSPTILAGKDAGTIYSRTKIYLETSWKTQFLSKNVSSCTASTLTSLQFTANADSWPSNYAGYASMMYGTSLTTAAIGCHRKADSNTDWIIASSYTIVAPTSLSDGFTCATNASSRFTKLNSLVFNNFDTSETTNFYRFLHSSPVTTLTFGEKFTTANATNMRQMFNSLKNLTTLDLSQFDMCSATNYGSFLEGSSKIVKLNTPYNSGSKTITIKLGSKMYVNGASSTTFQDYTLTNTSKTLWKK